MTDRLAVWLGGERVGWLTPDQDPSGYAFAFADAAGSGPPTLSVSLPPAGGPFGPLRARPFFDGLLPEDAVREQIARQLRISPGNSFRLLAELGRDCAGAVVLTAEDEPAPAPGGRVRWLEDAQLPEHVEQLRSRPLGADRGRRASLAGAQSKTILVRDASGRFGLPDADAPSTHLLKPQWDDEWEDVAYNERFCMRVAECAGFRVARTGLLEVAGRQCLLVERYDRTLDGSRLVRVHQEDLCQALGVLPTAKHQREGGPGVRHACALVRDSSTRAGADVLELVDAIVLNWCLGNSDAHGKNLSLLHLDSGTRLAPLYDVLSTVVYEDLETEMAMAIGEQFDPEAVDRGDWFDMAEDCGLSATQLERRRGRLMARISECATTVAQLARSEGWHRPVLDRICGVVERRTGAGRGARD